MFLPEAFESFLKDFKSVIRDPAHALQNLHLDDTDVDEDDDGQPKVKYMSVLQKIANRQADSITIDLDDLDDVRKLK